MTFTQKPQLIYFPGRGRAELTRLIFAETNTEYEDIRTGDKNSVPEAIFGQLPAYKEGDFSLVQSLAIARYVAKSTGLYPEDAKQAAIADLLADAGADIKAKYVPVFFQPTPEKKQELLESLEKEALPKWLSAIEGLLKKNNGGNGFFVGEKLNYGDLAIFDVLDSIEILRPGKLSTEFPLLDAFRLRIASRPNIAKWLASRPESRF